MAEHVEDPAEEYFRLMSLMDSSLQSRRVVEMMRDHYRELSNYSDLYWAHRERFLRERASDIAPTRQMVILRNRLALIFKRR